MKLYDFPLSPYCQKVRIALSEKELAYDKTFVDLTKNEQRSQEFLRLNPYGKVPVLIDDEEVIYDSTFINEYLDDEYPFADNSFTVQCGLLYAEVRKSEDLIDQERVQRYKTDLIRVLEFLDRHLNGREYLVEEFSLADLAFIPRLLSLRQVGVELPSRLKSVTAWIERLTERSSIVQLQQELDIS